MSRRPFHNADVSFTKQKAIYTEMVKNSANWKLTKQAFRKIHTKFYPLSWMQKCENTDTKRNFKFKRDCELRRTWLSSTKLRC